MIDEIQPIQEIKYVPYTKAQFTAKNAVISLACIPEWEGGASNYSNGLEDVNGIIWMEILPEDLYQEFFSEAERLTAKVRSEIVLPINEGI